MPLSSREAVMDLEVLSLDSCVRTLSLLLNLALQLLLQKNLFERLFENTELGTLSSLEQKAHATSSLDEWKALMQVLLQSCLLPLASASLALDSDLPNSLPH